MKVIKFLAKLGIFLFISFVIGMITLYIYAYLSPKLDLKKSGSLLLYDNSNNLIYQGSTSNEWANIDDISHYLIDAVIAVEDKNFYKHNGFDYPRIIKAMMLNIKNGKIVQGASTISQQYIKNLYLDFEKTWKRKIEEAFLTLELEVHYSKDEILEGYLNSINFGGGNIGVVNASMYYFNKRPDELSLEEAIMLAGIPKNPSKYNPVVHYDDCISRARVVALAMLNNDYIDQSTYDNLFNNEIAIYGQMKVNNLQMLMYYQEAVLDELYNIDEISTSMINAGGLKIYTNLNMDVQTKLEESILEFRPDDDAQIASVVVNPNNGAVIALTGGMDYAESQYNRALKSVRQVGSTMKPFLYYAALENNMTMSSTFASVPTTFQLSTGNSYSPQNAGGKYANKDITMAAALALSDNIYAVKTNLFLGVDKMIDVAKRCGIKANLEEVASLPLGTSEINILDFAKGYTTFASGGYQRNLYFIERIEDLDGNVIYEHKDKKELVLNPNYTYILNEMMTSTSNDAFVDYTTPTALTIASMFSNKYAIKTGSTNTDFWIVGYNPDALVITWTGYDDNKTLNTSMRKCARMAWVNTIEYVLKDVNTSWYDTPKNVVAIPLDAITGEITNDTNRAALFYYVKGSEPSLSTEQFVSKEKEG